MASSRTRAIAVATGVRSLTRSPGFSLVAIATLAVCIAANAAIFSVYDRLVVRPVDLPAPDTLVAIWSNNAKANFYAPALSWPRFQEIRRSARSFSALGVSAGDSFTLTAPDQQPLQLNGQRVSGDFFHTLGVMPARGRAFTAADDVPNGPAVCILSHELWTTRFGARDNIVGDVVQLNGQSWQVVGIMPPHLTQPFTQVDVFAPRVFEIAGLTAAQVDVGAGYTQVIARLAAGVTLTQAASELASLDAAYGRQFPGRLDAANTAVIRAYADSIAGTFKPTFYTLLGAVGFVLLIACANVASLFVGRLNARQKDIAIRQSLGASRAAVVRELLAESVTIAVVAGLAGLLLSRLVLDGIAVLVAAQLPPNTTFALDWRVAGFIGAVVLMTALLIGVVPALHASRPDIVTLLNDATRGSSGARGRRLRSALIVLEVALSVVLLVGSSLLLLSFLSLERLSPGFDPSGVATAFVGVPLGRYGPGRPQADFFTHVVEELRRDGRVTHAAASLSLPILGFSPRAPYSVQGRPIKLATERPLANFSVVSEDYFATLRIPFVKGRAFTADDRDGAPLVCIVNQTLANHVFPNESAIGRVLLRGRNAEIASTIVGVIGDLRSGGLTAPPPEEVYYPMRQLPRPGLIITARTAGDPAALQSAMRTAVAAVDRDQSLSAFQTLDSLLAQSLGIQRIVATLTACFAAIALALAAIGLYAVVSYSAAQRSGEIGIRMALGARPRQVLGLIMGGGLKMVGLGVAIGLAGAAVTAKLIQTLLSNVQPLDPLVYAGVALFFGVLAAAACFVPSFRASQVDPLVALGDRRAR